MKKILAWLLVLVMLLSLGLGALADEKKDAGVPEGDKSDDGAPAGETAAAGEWELSADGSYYALKNVVYCDNVVDADYQYMNIYVPAAYLLPDGSVNPEGSCCGYTAKTAPVVFKQDCAGWKSSFPGRAEEIYLNNGFVFVSCGARSRGLENGAGKAPSAAVDQKAGVRMLRLHDAFIPGDKEKIISVGSSGGGQMSSILGASGNMDYYFPYLYEIGAPGVEKSADGYVSTIRDNIYGSQCYCPIADLNNADLAYAWLRYDVGEPIVQMMFGGTAEFTPFQFALQEDAAQEYCRYINSLGLKDPDGKPLSFDENPDGSLNPRAGSYYEKTLENISNGLNWWIADKLQADGSIVYEKGNGPFGPKEKICHASVEDYLATFKYQDQWLKKKEDGSYTVTDLHNPL